MTVYRNQADARALAALLTAEDDDGWQYVVRAVAGGFVVRVVDATGVLLGAL